MKAEIAEFARSGADEWDQFFVDGQGRLSVHLCTAAHQECVADDLCLLFKPVAFEWSARHYVVAIAAKWMAHQRKIPFAAPLRLPDMGHFMYEMTLKV